MTVRPLTYILNAQQTCLSPLPPMPEPSSKGIESTAESSTAVTQSHMATVAMVPYCDYSSHGPIYQGVGVCRNEHRAQFKSSFVCQGKQARSQRHFGATATLRKKKLDAKDVLLRTRATVIVAANVDEFNDIVSKCPRRSLRWGKALQSRARSFAYAPLSQRNEVTSAAVNRTSHELALGHAADLPLGVELRRPQQLTRG